MFAFARSQYARECDEAIESGICVRCRGGFTPSSNKLRNPETGEEKISPLCQECRKKIVKDVLNRLERRNHN